MCPREGGDPRLFQHRSGFLKTDPHNPWPVKRSADPARAPKGRRGKAAGALSLPSMKTGLSRWLLLGRGRGVADAAFRRGDLAIDVHRIVIGRPSCRERVCTYV